MISDPENGGGETPTEHVSGTLRSVADFAAVIEPTPDDALLRWPDIADRYARGAVLLGNGVSINVAPAFDYRSLWAKAATGWPAGGFTAADRRLFDAFGEHGNFERVLADLAAAIAVAGACEQPTAVYEERYDSIRRALGAAVHAVHVAWADVAAETLEALCAGLLAFDHVFTTNYDLLVYWAMSRDFPRFDDGFRADGRHVAGEPIAGRTAVHFLHGALHLVVDEEDGGARKLRRGSRALLDQFGHEEPGTHPLLVTEGTAADKRRTIKANAYLDHCLERLREHDGPLVVLGHSLSRHDQHLIDAIRLHPDRRVAVSVHPAERELARQRICVALDREQVECFDSTTHPLAAPGLRAAPADPWAGRRPQRWAQRRPAPTTSSP